MNLDFTSIVRPGDTVLWTPGVGEPLPLLERLLAQRHDIGGFSVLYGGAGYADLVRPEHADVISFRTLGAVGGNRVLCAAGVAAVLPCHLSDLPRLIASGVLHVDVVIAQLSENDQGALSFGPVSGYVGTAMHSARTVVAEINDQAPWTHSRHPVGRVDIAVRTSRPLVEVASRPPSPTAEAIAGYVVDLVGDRSTVQIGIGAVPDAVAARLTHRRELGLHSGVIGDAAVDLISAGAVSGVSVTGALIGTRRLFDFAHGNDRIRVEPVTYTHDPGVLRQLPRFTAINSALEVDLTGQVAAEVAGRSYVGTIGGQGDFARAALASDGGRSIIALPSRTTSGRPRIVSRIASGVVTTARADADTIVTEYGVAELCGRAIPERVRRMIAIAHPEDRETLAKQAHDDVAGYR
ncbi:acetyl-CoA hydrolase [Acrocarpospora corrugata]|uniref:Acetyl-CoA hydrolase n=1 Tax=Acrocarpospora corrugata TaxID=35763 RepID=A0A5M3WBG3_9ACTN|nr:acetyl-CoA hydrolase/transferase C-terminal domain-containing protein [Acrocarpospora corrugata]GES05709.1 acetyl-CoA hydrolase [Acrocarpospora corrugata]